ncbi:hypothetical protein HAQ01_01730 [Acidithiobacillus thiooxidans]|jgi:predicted RNase H-like HicB family nuclease|uniref:hypothetical protein n=1 Tax=Acidithiobacillus thiooxidans TaxID=930 RepID=UPI000262531E|nr:hypothetical protein [Acidithiobacillus thiooxidans]MBU2792157.1 hypothetical protein [Acidithiobacillus thiooxidans]
MMDFNGFPFRVWFDSETQQWEAMLLDVPDAFVSAGGCSPEKAIEELRIAWDLCFEGEKKPYPAATTAA